MSKIRKSEIWNPKSEIEIVPHERTGVKRSKCFYFRYTKGKVTQYFTIFVEQIFAISVFTTKMVTWWTRTSPAGGKINTIDVRAGGKGQSPDWKLSPFLAKCSWFGQHQTITIVSTPFSRPWIRSQLKLRISSVETQWPRCSSLSIWVTSPLVIHSMHPSVIAHSLSYLACE